ATGQLTVATWTKWDGPNGWHQGLIGKRDAWDDEGTQMMWYLAIDKDGHDIRFERGGSYPSCGGIVLPEGEWSHVAATFDGTTLIFYVDGAETGRDDFSFGAKTDATITLGCVEGGGWNGFNGALDDIRLYDYPLTLNEIKALAGIGQLLVPDLVGMSLTEAMAAIASAGLTLGAIGSEHSDTIAQGYVSGQIPSAGMSVAPGSSVELTLSLGPAVPETEACCYGDGSCADLTASECMASGGEPQGVGATCATTSCPGAPIGTLVAHWKLNEAADTMAYDSSGNSNDGILMGDPTWQPADGKVDGALLFDGVDDYVDCGTFNPSEHTGELSVCLWANCKGLTGQRQGLI
ncbi:MAG: PASTA domain-containing protein, partial [Phycisphaerales bacterium]